MATELTISQSRVLRYLEERDASGEAPPTYRDICRHFGYKSPKAAVDHICALVKKGFLTRDKRHARGIRVVRQNPGVPVLGKISAGNPREAFSVPDGTLQLDLKGLGIADPANAFALRVNGDSMIGRNVSDGDIVLVERGVEPKNGDIIAALIDNEVTLKTFVRKSGRVWLHAENPRYPDIIPVLDLQVQGVVRAVIRVLTK